MDRFVELCLSQYYAEEEKQKLLGTCTATAINSAQRDSYTRQINDIMHYARDGKHYIELLSEFDRFIKKNMIGQH